jgi:prepilin-type N-terminal cleavage/methylation domain-containing protein
MKMSSNAATRYAEPHDRRLGATRQDGAYLDCTGFTLLELLVVCAIIGVLATLALPSYSYYQTKVKIATATAEIHVIDREIIAYVLDKNALPNTLADTGIILASLKDPWGRPYVYHATQTYHNGASFLNDSYDLYSKGVDGLTSENLLLGNDSKDDVVRAADGGYVGLGSEYSP